MQLNELKSINDNDSSCFKDCVRFKIHKAMYYQTNINNERRRYLLTVTYKKEDAFVHAYDIDRNEWHIYSKCPSNIKFAINNMILDESNAILYIFGNIAEEFATLNLKTKQWQLYDHCLISLYAWRNLNMKNANCIYLGDHINEIHIQSSFHHIKYDKTQNKFISIGKISFIEPDDKCKIFYVSTMQKLFVFSVTKYEIYFCKIKNNKQKIYKWELFRNIKIPLFNLRGLDPCFHVKVPVHIAPQRIRVHRRENKRLRRYFSKIRDVILGFGCKVVIFYANGETFGVDLRSKDVFQFSKQIPKPIATTFDVNPSWFQICAYGNMVHCFNTQSIFHDHMTFSLNDIHCTEKRQYGRDLLVFGYTNGFERRYVLYQSIPVGVISIIATYYHDGIYRYINIQS